MNDYEQSLKEELGRFPKVSLLNKVGEEVLPYRDQLREGILRNVLGLGSRPAGKGVVLESKLFTNYRREKLIIENEPGCWQTALLYLPVERLEKQIPGVLLTSGHGGSKSPGYNQIVAQLYVKLGCVVLVVDPIGEEERNEPYGLGLRGHRKNYVVDRMNEQGKPFIGKVVFDYIAGLEYLRGREDVDSSRIACAGSSMGGTLVQLLIAVEPNIHVAILSSWAADYACLEGNTGCCYRLPGLIHYAGQLELMAMAAPECALLICSGKEDEITPPNGLDSMGERLHSWWKSLGVEGHFSCYLEEGGGHRPFHLTPLGLKWIAKHFELDETKISETPLQSIGAFYKQSGKSLEPLYDKPRHHQGTLFPSWPVQMESPETLRVLNDSVLQAHGLSLKQFTLQGYLREKKILELDPVPPYPAERVVFPEEAKQRTLRMIENVSSTFQWHSSDSCLFQVLETFQFFELLKARVFPENFSRSRKTEYTTESGNGIRSVSLGIYNRRLLIKSHNKNNRGVFVLSREDSGLNQNLYDSTQAWIQLVSLSDHETLLGWPALFVNLLLIMQAFHYFDSTGERELQWEIQSEIPRLGELAFLFLPRVKSLSILAASAVEPAENKCIGRAENIVPHALKDFQWLDPLMATSGRKVRVKESYLHPIAQEQLKKHHSTIEFLA